jgi:hypothetical protein
MSWIEQKNIGKVTVIVSGYLAAGDPPGLFINNTDGQIGGTNVQAVGGGRYVLWAEADLSAWASGDAPVVISYLASSASGSDFYVDSVVVIPHLLVLGSASFYVAAKPSRSPATFFGDAEPTLNYPWAVGDTIIKRTPVVGQPLGWKCTVAGSGSSPGTWVALANL